MKVVGIKSNVVGSISSPASTSAKGPGPFGPGGPGSKAGGIDEATAVVLEVPPVFGIGGGAVLETAGGCWDDGTP